MVLDLIFTARQKNEGNLALSCHIGFPGLGEDGITVEAAPTTDIEITEKNGILDVCTTYKIPQEKNDAKTVRMIFRMNHPEEIDAGINLVLAGNRAVTMMGTSYMPDLMAEDIFFEEFIPVWKRDNMPTWGKVLLTIGVIVVLFFIACIIVGASSATEWWETFMPVISWLATAVLMILLFCLTPFAWWVVLIDTLVMYTALTLWYVLAANIVDGNVGSCTPLAFGLLISAVGSIVLLLLMTWSWWIPLIIAVVASGLLALTFGAIGNKM